MSASKTPETDETHFRYLLIAHCDHGGFVSLRSYETEDARKKATLLELSGWQPEDQQKVLDELEEDGIAEFEGDPPLRWMTATAFRDEALESSRNDLLEEGLRAIGDHFPPNDCYATGPLTGDAHQDLVGCPACAFIAKAAAIARASEGRESK